MVPVWLPIFPAVVRYDECERGMVEHAMRFTVRRTRRGYVLPATHWASRHFDRSFPRMGERFSDDRLGGGKRERHGSVPSPLPCGRPKSGTAVS